jgi:hypothetical protein
LESNEEYAVQNTGYAGPRTGTTHGCLYTTVVTLVIVFLPVIGHIICTVYVLGDDLTASEKLIWLLLIWLVPFLGPLLYLLVGQRRNRIFGA